MTLIHNLIYRSEGSCCLFYSTFVCAIGDFALFYRQYNVSEPSYLFEALDASAREDNALANYNGITIDSYFRTWSEKAGHPLLTVSIDQRTGEMKVTQV